MTFRFSDKNKLTFFLTERFVEDSEYILKVSIYKVALVENQHEVCKVFGQFNSQFSVICRIFGSIISVFSRNTSFGSSLPFLLLVGRLSRDRVLDLLRSLQINTNVS